MSYMPFKIYQLWLCHWEQEEIMLSQKKIDKFDLNFNSS